MRLAYLWFMLVGILGSTAFAAEKPERKHPMDYGPALATSVVQKIGDKTQVLAHKALAIRVSPDRTVVFDTDLLTYATAWSGGFLDFRDTMMTNNKGTSMPAPAGPLVFRSTGPGIAKRSNESAPYFSDPRAEKVGPLPRERGRYEGMHVHGESVVLAYSIDGVKVLDLPGYDAAASSFTRTLHIGKTDAPLSLLVCDAHGKEDYRAPSTDGASSLEVSDDLFFFAQFLPNDAALEIQGGQGHSDLPEDRTSGDGAALALHGQGPRSVFRTCPKDDVA